MDEFDSKVKIRLNAKDTDLSDYIKDQPCWNRLSLNEDDEEFSREYRHPIESTNELEPSPIEDKARSETRDPTPDSYDGS